MALPPLSAIRFFNVAAQTENFVQAAERLHVTHGAVSRQVRILEEALGVALFERRNRAVFLTPAGRALYAVTSLVIEQLEDAVARIQQAARDNVLTVSCEPTIAMRWLIPRLPSFKQVHPDIAVHLVAAGGPIDFRRTGVDLALRRDDFHWDESVLAEKICDEWVGPVCAPRIKLRTHMEGMHLLHSGSRPDAWKRWHRLAGVPAKGASRADYEHFYLCIQAALAGLGVSMASFLMVGDELKNGQLHAPYGFLRDGSSYCVLIPKSSVGNDNCNRFRDWIRAQAASTLACLPA
ncbi:LysR family transcriptional regulator [Bordetella ansorpii]|uniref:LysR family transcriptional regulator n=1 Tax=Bordetella ansorpii TaxID=288768 RepID=A0A157QM71_9BORD|nr:LysR substrate-binding domain-containing protein [Bordetella ansorpii]SAI46694.1 LysR family transcriptional regulator [Bordetella ansorpii]